MLVSLSRGVIEVIMLLLAIYTFIKFIITIIANIRRLAHLPTICNMRFAIVICGIDHAYNTYIKLSNIIKNRWLVIRTINLWTNILSKVAVVFKSIFCHFIRKSCHLCPDS